MLGGWHSTPEPSEHLFLLFIILLHVRLTPHQRHFAIPEQNMAVPNAGHNRGCMSTAQCVQCKSCFSGSSESRRSFQNGLKEILLDTIFSPRPKNGGMGLQGIAKRACRLCHVLPIGIKGPRTNAVVVAKIIKQFLMKNPGGQICN